MAVSDDLLTDQRVLRACDALHAAGYNITLVGRAWPDARPLPKPYRTVKMWLLFRSSPLFYAELNLKLFFKFLCSAADAFYANDTDTLLAVGLAARLRRKPFVFDGHELFPDVPELINKPLVRKVWSAIEWRFIPKAATCITVNQSVADEYRRRYGVGFAVVRNLSALPAGTEESLRQPEPATLLYQGAVNKGRCVRQLIDAMAFLPAYKLVVAGVGDLLGEMKDYAASKPYADRISFAGRLNPDELRRLTPHAALGLCLLENMGLNYYLSLPNRISDYAAAGVPVLASDFPEIRRVVEQHRIGATVGESVVLDPAQLALAIDNTVRQWAAMPYAERQARFASARSDMSWQNEQKKLIAAIDTIFAQKLS